MSSWGAIGVPQRRWVLRRDGNRCQHFSFLGRWVQCTVRRDLHVHHILPQRHMTTHVRHIDPHRPNNLITLCKFHHNGKNGVHPDMHRALQNYRKGDKASFEDTMKGRNVLVQSGEIYWNTKFDWQYTRRAKKLTASYSKKYPYPRKRRRPGWKKPRK